MGIMDSFDKEDRVQMKFSTMYSLMKEAAKCELVMNAVNCDVPHLFIREMATGEREELQKPSFVNLFVNEGEDDGGRKEL